MPPAGAHIVLWLHKRLSEAKAIAAAARCNVGIYGIGSYYLKRAPRAGLMLGYPRLRPEAIREGVRRLADVIA